MDSMFEHGFHWFALTNAWGQDEELILAGLMSKVELIRTYLKHHDRLDVILQSAIRPYGLIAQPPARLSLFLDLSILLAWYSSVLILEMRARMDSVLDVWSDIRTHPHYLVPPLFGDSQAFLYLSEAYQRALSDPRSNSPRSASGVGSERVVAAGAKEWLGMVEEEEFSEYLTFLASVANDAYRVYTTNLINFDDIGAQDDVLATLDTAVIAAS
eukprot:gene3595-3937_t